MVPVLKELTFWWSWQNNHERQENMGYGIKGHTGGEGALGTWGLGGEGCAKIYPTVPLPITDPLNQDGRIHHGNEDLWSGLRCPWSVNAQWCHAGLVCSVTEKDKNAQTSLCVPEGLTSAWGQWQPAGITHYEGEEGSCQVEQAINSVQGGWAHPKWVILSFP